jgi:hypothetical protein
VATFQAIRIPRLLQHRANDLQVRERDRVCRGPLLLLHTLFPFPRFHPDCGGVSCGPSMLHVCAIYRLLSPEMMVYSLCIPVRRWLIETVFSNFTRIRRFASTRRQRTSKGGRIGSRSQSGARKGDARSCL